MNKLNTTRTAFYLALLRNSIKHFQPSAFVIVMATGIVSIAFDLLDFTAIARPLFALNSLFYGVFCLLLATRIIFFRQDLILELRALAHSYLFLAFAAGTNTFGVQLITLAQASTLANILWHGAFLAWFVCMSYIVFNLLKASPAHAIASSTNGATLLLTVSTASIVLPASYLSSATSADAPIFSLLLWSIWLLSCTLYLFVICLIIRQLFFNHSAAQDWHPAYWICMGELAIITLAGSELLAHLPHSLGANLEQITLTISLSAWALGTLWIPYLLVMDIRKFAGKQNVPLWITIFPWIRLAYCGKYRIYSIEAWSRVFPAGMYTASTFSLANTSGYYFLESISFYWCQFALLVWLFTLSGAIHSLTADENILVNNTL